MSKKWIRTVDVSTSDLFEIHDFPNATHMVMYILLYFLPFSEKSTFFAFNYCIVRFKKISLPFQLPVSL
jgi:hypothetical protein